MLIIDSQKRFLTRLLVRGREGNFNKIITFMNIDMVITSHFHRLHKQFRSTLALRFISLSLSLAHSTHFSFSLSQPRDLRLFSSSTHSMFKYMNAGVIIIIILFILSLFLLCSFILKIIKFFFLLIHFHSAYH